MKKKGKFYFLTLLIASLIGIVLYKILVAFV
jgi:hypothetical protein